MSPNRLGFLDLDLLDRERIYRYALTTSCIFIRPFISMKYILDEDSDEGRNTITLALLRTCKQVYQEALPIFLGENVFSLIQVDLLAAARQRSPRVFQNLKMIRHLELVFDSRDYIYMARFVAEQVPGVMAMVQSRIRPSTQKEAALEALGELYSRVDISMLQPTEPEPTELSTPSSSSPPKRDGVNNHLPHHHSQLTSNLKEYLWGRTLSFVRQTFHLSHLYVDLRHCTCVDGCCRLAAEVLDWGALNVWVHGIAAEVHVLGASSWERGEIAQVLEGQQLRRRLLIQGGYEMEVEGENEDEVDDKTLAVEGYASVLTRVAGSSG